MAPNKLLENKVAIITGAGSGAFGTSMKSLNDTLTIEVVNI